MPPAICTRLEHGDRCYVDIFFTMQVTAQERLQYIFSIAFAGVLIERYIAEVAPIAAVLTMTPGPCDEVIHIIVNIMFFHCSVNCG